MYVYFYIQYIKLHTILIFLKVCYCKVRLKWDIAQLRPAESSSLLRER